MEAFMFDVITLHAVQQMLSVELHGSIISIVVFFPLQPRCMVVIEMKMHFLGTFSSSNQHLMESHS